jgi:DNA-binding transcriptional LysR family regulator
MMAQIRVKTRTVENKDSTGEMIMATAHRHSRATRGLRLATALLLAGSATSALAQDVAASDSDEGIIVTGSRIARSDAASVGPITTLTQDDILYTAPTSVGDLIQALPGVGVSLNNNGTQGTAFGVSSVNLRYLGSAEGSGNRTLVLVDGKRWINAVGGRGFRDFVDLNTVPMGIVDNIEVLKDGASAIYGADAIAGVVNIKTKRKIDGIDANGRVLGSVARVSALIEDIAAFRTGELRLVAPPSLCESVLPDIAARFLARFPGVRLSIDSRSVETARLMIANRMVDCGFLKLPLDRADLAAETLIESEAVCVMAHTHPLASEPSLTPALLGRSPLILLGQGRTSRIQIEASFSAAGLRPNVRVETHTIGSACALAARGIGVTIVNSLLARPYLRETLIARPLTPRLPQNYAFATAADTPPSRLALALLAESRAYLAGLGTDG